MARNLPEVISRVANVGSLRWLRITGTMTRAVPPPQGGGLCTRQSSGDLKRVPSGSSTEYGSGHSY